jgi:putative ABC transport system ATP-binding protein
MEQYAISLKQINKSYKDGDEERIILSNISLDVKPGEFVAIVGPSGSGKSTLLSIAGILLSPDQGDIIIGNKQISAKKQKQRTILRREKVGFIFQNHQLLPFLTVSEQLQMVQDMTKKKGTSSDISELLEDLGLTACKNKYPEHMSGGEKQRTAIARAFMNNPEVILADEPTASLDGERGRQVVEMIRKEVKKRNKAAIMVTHDERILDLVDTIYHLEKGKLKKMAR